jgi:DNA-binding NarL/FixJ family response regulator
MVRILIADDRELVRTTLRQALQRSDANWHVCGEAANGREAIDKAVALAPDVIILDIAMPVLDGIGATKEIHARLPDVPILMYTFMSFGHLEALAKEAGAQAVVQKGDLRALIGAIRSVLAATLMGNTDATFQGDVVQPVSNSIASGGAAAMPGEMDAVRGEAAEASATDRVPQIGETEADS